MSIIEKPWAVLVRKDSGVEIVWGAYVTEHKARDECAKLIAAIPVTAYTVQVRRPVAPGMTYRPSRAKR